MIDVSKVENRSEQIFNAFSIFIKRINQTLHQLGLKDSW